MARYKVRYHRAILGKGGTALHPSGKILTQEQYDGLSSADQEKCQLVFDEPKPAPAAIPSKARVIEPDKGPPGYVTKGP